MPCAKHTYENKCVCVLVREHTYYNTVLKKGIKHLIMKICLVEQSFCQPFENVLNGECKCAQAR